MTRIGQRRIPEVMQGGGFGGQSYLLRDEFSDNRAAGAFLGVPANPGPGDRTGVDTNGIMSTAGGVLVVNGTTAANDRFHIGSVARVAGRVFKITFPAMATTGGSGNIKVGFTLDGTTNANLVPGFDFVAANQFRIKDSGSTIYTFTQTAPHSFAFVTRATGGFEFALVSGNWTLLYIAPSDGTATLFPKIIINAAIAVNFTHDSFRVPQALYIPTLWYDSFTHADGALGSSESVGPDGQAIESKVWQGGTGWAVLGNAAKNTLTPGAEQLADPGLEATYTAGLCNSLTKSGSPTLAQSADVHGGTKAQQLAATIQNDSVAYSSGYTPPAGTWVLASWWAKRSAGAGGTLVGRIREAGITNRTVWDGIVSGSYIQQFASLKFTGVGQAAIDIIDGGAASFDTGIVDDFSVKPLTLSDLLSGLQVSASDVHVRVPLTFPSNANGQIGFLLNLDSISTPANFVLATIRKVSAPNIFLTLEKCVAGAYTPLIGTSPIVYSAGAYLYVIKRGTSYWMFYNNVLISTMQTVGDAGIVNNTLFCMFDSIGRNAAFGAFEVWPDGGNGEHGRLGTM